MTTKRDWLTKLKALKTEQRALTPSECDELILLLGGSAREPGIPAKIQYGSRTKRHYSLLRTDAAVSGFLYRADELEWIEGELKKGTEPLVLVEKIRAQWGNSIIGHCPLSELTNEYASFCIARHLQSLRSIVAEGKTDKKRIADAKCKAAALLGLSKTEIKNLLSNQSRTDISKVEARLEQK